jgi:hypothetical protein
MSTEGLPLMTVQVWFRELQAWELSLSLTVLNYKQRGGVKSRTGKT